MSTGIGHPVAVEAEAEILSQIARTHGAVSVEEADTPAQAELWWKGRKAAFGKIEDPQFCCSIYP